MPSHDLGLQYSRWVFWGCLWHSAYKPRKGFWYVMRQCIRVTNFVEETPKASHDNRWLHDHYCMIGIVCGESLQVRNWGLMMWHCVLMMQSCRRRRSRRERRQGRGRRSRSGRKEKERWGRGNCWMQRRGQMNLRSKHVSCHQKMDSLKKIETMSFLLRPSHAWISLPTNSIGHVGLWGLSISRPVSIYMCPVCVYIPSSSVAFPGGGRKDEGFSLYRSITTRRAAHGSHSAFV